MREGKTNRSELTDRWKQRAGLVPQHQPIGFHPAGGLLSYPRHMMILLGVILVGLFAWLPTLEASATKPANQAIEPAPVKITPYEKIEINRRARREIRGLIRLVQKTDNSRKSFSPPARTKTPPAPRRVTPPPRRVTPPPPRRVTPPPKKRVVPPPPRKRVVPPPPKKRVVPPPPKKRAVPPPPKKAPPPPKTPPAPPPSDTGEQKGPPASEKICASIPTYPGCEQFNAQEESTLEVPEGGGIRHPSICEQNPQLPQCQQDQPDGAGNQNPPAPPPPPGGSGPTPPAPPPPPPPPAGPTIQSSDVCPEGQVLDGNTCVAECPAGKVKAFGGNYCVIDQTCPEGQVYSGGQCTEGIGYEDYLPLCLAAVEQARAEQIEWPYGVVGATDEETCRNTIGQQCEEDYSDLNARVCQERPCPDGQDNVNGQCVASCVAGSERVGAICQCSGGQVLQEGGVCAASCAEGTVLDRNGQCTSQCEFGTVLNGQCFQGPNCPRGYTRQENGVCVATSSQPPGGPPNAEGICANVNSDPLYDIYNGLCVLRRDAPYEAVLENCLAGRGIGDGLASVDQTACEQLIVDSCKSIVDLGRNFTNQQMARYCGDIANPADGEYVPPPTAGTEQPAEGIQLPPDGEAPPPDTGTPPPPPAEDEQPPVEVDQPPAEDQQPPPDTGTQPPPPPGTGTPPPPAPGKFTKRPPGDTITGYRKRMAAREPLGIVIANALYDSDLIPASPHAVGGAAAFTRYLVNDRGLPTSRIISQRNMSRGNFVALFGKPGTPGGFLKNILTSEPAFELIIYYTGRAMVVDGGKDAVLLTRNANIDQPGQTGYRLSELYRQLAKLGVKRLRLYLDTAFSKPLNAQPARGSVSAKAVQSAPKIGPRGIFTPRNWVVITASSGNQPAYVNPERPSSAFSDVLIAGLRGGADSSVVGNNDSAVTAGELKAFLSDRLQKIVQPATGGKQRPVLSGPRSEVLAINEARQPEPAPTPPPALPPSGTIAPSFNCARAATQTEKAICANSEIATLDNVMVDLYRKARRARHGAARRALQAQQRNWLRQRNACASDIACLVQRYGERIEQLQ